MKLYQAKFNIDYPQELEAKGEERKEKIRQEQISWQNCYYSYLIRRFVRKDLS